METAPIENLRIAFAQSVIATMATQVSTYLRLVAHPEVQFGDLLEALGRNAVIGDDAAQRLHRRLSLPMGTGAPMVQRGYWEQILMERHIPLTAPIRGPVTAAPAPVSAALPDPLPMPASATVPSPAIEEAAPKTS